MGVDCDIYLPASARLDDIAHVIGICVGFKKKQESLKPYHSDGWYVDVEGVKVRGTDSVPTMPVINLEPNSFQAQMVYCHLETSPLNGKSMAAYKHLSTCSRPVWLAIGKRLIDTFGGMMIYRDTGDGIPDYRKPTRRGLDAEDGEAWQKVKELVWSVEPLTDAEIAAMKKHAAYDE